MPKKKVKDEVKTVDVTTLSLSDLLALHTFVVGDANRVFGPNVGGRVLVKSRLNEIEAELNNRVYGKNPFESKPLEGARPEDIDLNQFDDPKPNKRFVVMGHETSEE